MTDVSPCGGCSGCSSEGHHGCGACCSGEVILCKEEVSVLSALAQLAFLPICCRTDLGSLSYLPVTDNYGLSPTLFTQVIASLSYKGLITVDPEIPIKNVDYRIQQKDDNLTFGSIALTAKGQEILDYIDHDDL